MEWIGKKVEIVEASNKSMVGISGIVEDETRNTFVIEGRRIPKKDAVFRVHVDGKRYRVPGSSIVGRPEDRIRKKVRRW